MGVVYRAWNLRLKRIEAVKVISEDFVRDKSFRDRFARETELAASIEHPNVVTLYDSGEGPGGELFIAMRYVEGTTLECLIRERGFLDPGLAADLIAQVGSALDAAHGQGLVHRDIKPANILIAGDGADGEYHAYLTDFGLAKRVSSKTALTRAGLMVGTIDFMAPEQAGARPVDLRADVYALGTTLFVALTGQVPYPREGDLARLVAKLEPPPVASRVTPGVPPAFDPVIAKAMAEDPDARWASAGELGEAAQIASGRRTAGSSREHGAPDQITVGSVIDGRYRIEAEAGSGGMAVVYRAMHLKLAKTVALKVMSPNLAVDPEFRRRFENEARSASEIDHENVIPVYDFGEDGHGLYIVMRYVETNLRDLLRARGVMDPLRAVQVIEQVASALDAAHGRGLLHRDIKPANILVEESTSRIFLADFGLVRSARDDEGVTGARVLGTDAYMAPERRHHEETRLGDVYSLGCVLWEMLAGPGHNLPGRSAVTAEVRVPSGLYAVVEKSVSERPRERYASAGELAGAARAALAPATRVEQRRQESPAFHDPLSAGLSVRVLDLCTQTLPTAAAPAVREELEGIRARLAEPLVMAVAGRAGTGKSTVANALLGRRIADTGAGETARVVTWFRYGNPDHVELVLVDGERERLDLTNEGELPNSLGISLEQIAAIEVYLSANALKSLTIVDMPGAETIATQKDAKSTEDTSGAAGAIERADALLFAMAGDAAAADREALAAFRRRFEGSGHASAVNAIGVLTKADLLPGDVLDRQPAIDRAQRLRDALGPLVSSVVPLVAHIAQTANAGALEQDDVDRLARWAQLDVAERELLLPADSAASRGRLADGPARVLRLLGRYGVALAFELADSGDPFNVVSLNRRLRELSGIDELRKQIDGVQLRTDALKADRALIELESLSWRHQVVDLRNQVDRMRLDTPLLELMRLFDRCASGQIELDEGKLSELEQLLTGRTMPERLGLGAEAGADEVRKVATRRARSWRTWAGGGLASFQGQQVANKVDDVYMQIAFED